VNYNEAQRRMFDLNGLDYRCPFRESKQANEFVGHLVNGTRLENEQSSNNLLDNHEIVDDANLFVINVGLVDPCWVIAPVKYKNGCSQCFETINDTIEVFILLKSPFQNTTNSHPCILLTRSPGMGPPDLRL